MSFQSSINSAMASVGVAKRMGDFALQKDQERLEKAKALQQKQELANETARKIVEARFGQRGNIYKALQNKDTSLGKFGDLDPKLQKTIAGQMTPYERHKEIKGQKVNALQEELKKGNLKPEYRQAVEDKLNKVKGGKKK